MLFQIVHASGTATYFIFFILFVWMSRIPRTNPGAGWWALSIFCIFVARLGFMLLSFQDDFRLTLSVYAALLVLEKPFLLIGIIRFLDLGIRPAWLHLLAIAAELWVLAFWRGHLSELAFGIGFSLYNVAALAFVAVTTYRQRHGSAHRILLVTSLVSALLALHWTSFVLIFHSPQWRVMGFVVGTLLVMIQYLTLLGAVLMQFQKRLLEAEEQALNLAYHDPLTGLNNKQYMNMLFEKALLLATRPHHLVAVLYIDLDNFKPINDAAGHATGDEVLKTVARRLKDHTRSTDICARIGGDEFVVVATQLEHQEQAHDIAHKLLQQLTLNISVGQCTYTLGASIGVSLYPLHGDNLKQLIDNADSAMYQIKRQGKSGYWLYESTGCTVSPPAMPTERQSAG